MENPWLSISHHDYENHMTAIGQAQVLNGLTKYCLDKYRPESFALLGCSTGNGLEHIRPEITKRVYAIDIHPEYLKIVKERFEDQINNLEIVYSDIQHDELTMNNIDLFFVGLVLEYVEPEKALKKVIKTLNKKGIIIIVIQKNRQASFVSKTKYKSLEKLSVISKEVNEREIDKFIQSQKMRFVKREEIKLTENKSFVLLEYRMKE